VKRIARLISGLALHTCARSLHAREAREAASTQWLVRRWRRTGCIQACSATVLWQRWRYTELRYGHINGVARERNANRMFSHATLRPSPPPSMHRGTRSHLAAHISVHLSVSKRRNCRSLNASLTGAVCRLPADKGTACGRPVPGSRRQLAPGGQHSRRRRGGGVSRASSLSLSEC